MTRSVHAGQRDGEARAARAQQHPELVLGVDGVHCRHDRPELPDAELRDHPLRAGRQHERDAIACAHAERREGDSRGVAQLVQGAPGQVASLEDQGGRLRASGRMTPEMVEERARRRFEGRGNAGVVMGEPGARVHGGTLSGTDAVGSSETSLSGPWRLRCRVLGDFAVGSCAATRCDSRRAELQFGQHAWVLASRRK